MTRLLWNAAPALALAFGCALAAGCYADAEPAVGYADVTSAPVDVAVTPSVYYEGRPVYYGGGRWWYRDGSRWAYYRREPAELARHRPVGRERHER